MEEGTFGARLAHAMTLAGADRKKLADHLEVSVQAVGQVLSGSSKAMTADKAARASRFLEVDYFWLATGEGEPRPTGLSEDAVGLARQYDKLDDEEKRRYRVLLLAARTGLSDAEVAKILPAVPSKERG